MKLKNKNYVNSLSLEKQVVFKKIFNVIKENLPQGYEEDYVFNLPSFVIPLKYYKPGYKPAKNTPLPLVSISATKNYISIYHMVLQGFKKELKWFENEVYKKTGKKLNMGVSCIRFKYKEKIPYETVGELFTKIKVDDYIKYYESLY